MESMSASKILTGKPKRNKSVGRPRRRRENNIRRGLREICINTRNWVDLAQDRDYWSFFKCGIEPP